MAIAAALMVGSGASAAPPPQPTFTFTGGGFGHGVGMPQYGAYGAALAGWDARRILAYFYRGTELSILGPGAIRVMLRPGSQRINVSSAGPWQIVDEATEPDTAVELQPATPYTVAPDGDGLVIAGPGGAVLRRFGGTARLQPISPTGSVTLGSGAYRGAMRLTRAGRRVRVVNIVALEQYLWGVVPREMPSKWGDDAPAALQAQAIAARTYAAAGVKPAAEFDVYPDQRSQVYGGVAAEDTRTTAAVDATRQQVLTSGGKLITAYFFSSSGGRTENAENVFTGGGALPYLRSVEDPFDAQHSPYHTWADPPTFTASRLGALLGLGAPVARVTVLRRGASGRVLNVRLAAASGTTVELTGPQVRRALGLRDTLFRIVRKRPTA